MLDSIPSSNIVPERDLETRAQRITYQELEAAGSKLLAERGRSQQQVANMKSALHGWTSALKLSSASFVGVEFMDQFDQHFLRYQDLLAESLALRTQKDRAEQVLSWRRLFAICRSLDTLPSTFTEALAVAIKRSTETRAEIARRAGMPANALTNWVVGTHTPHPASFTTVLALEKALNLPADTLIARLPTRRLSRYARAKRTTENTKFGERLLRNRAKTGPYALRPTARMLQQWGKLLPFKIDGSFAGASMRNTWRAKPQERSGIKVTWAMVFQGQICATAGFEWCLFSSYLGYLALSEPEGPGISFEQVDTLSWLAHAEYVKRYVSWQRARSDGMLHNGVLVFLDKVTSHLRPQTGFVWAHHQLLSPLPTELAPVLLPSSSPTNAGRELAWQAHCAATRVDILNFRRNLVSRTKVSKSRNTNARLATILADRFPLKCVLKAIIDLERDAPPVMHKRDYISWIRDVLMMKMISSNPLRAGQFSTMTWNGNSGNLYRTSDGCYRLRFEAADFKNEKGAAHEDYDVAVEESVFPWILRYLSESRPYLIGADENDYLFLPSTKGPRKPNELLIASGVRETGMWSAAGISTRMEHLTLRYLPETLGFGTQAFRHIVATDHLKQHPHEYANVAMLLHDTLATVLKNYDQRKTDDGLRVLHDGIGQSNRELRAARGT